MNICVNLSKCPAICFQLFSNLTCWQIQIVPLYRDIPREVLTCLRGAPCPVLRSCVMCLSFVHFCTWYECRTVHLLHAQDCPMEIGATEIGAKSLQFREGEHVHIMHCAYRITMCIPSISRQIYICNADYWHSAHQLYVIRIYIWVLRQ